MNNNNFASSDNTSLSSLEEIRLRKLEENADKYQKILDETKEEVIRKRYEAQIKQINAEIERVKGRAR